MGGGEGERGRASEGGKHGGGGGEVPLNLDGGVKQRGGVQKKRKEVQRESTGLTLCFGSSGIQVGPGRGGEGFRGAEEELILLNSHASWWRRGTRRKGRARARGRWGTED